MVQVDVHGGDHHLVMVVLDVGQRRLHLLLVVVVNQGDGPGDLLGAAFLAVFHQLGADHVGDCQRTVVVPLLPHHRVHLVHQGRGQRDADPIDAVFFYTRSHRDRILGQLRAVSNPPLGSLERRRNS